MGNFPRALPLTGASSDATGPSRFKSNTPTPASPVPLVAPDGGSGAWVLALYLVSPYATDLMMMSIGAKPYLSIVSGILVFLIFLLSGRAFRALKTTPGKLWLVLMIWLLVDLPFSYWSGGTLELLKGYIPKAHMILFYCGALAVNLKECRTLFLASVAGAFALLFECMRYGRPDDGGRFSIPDSMSFANPNDVGLELVVAIGLFVFLIVSKGWFSKLSGFAGLMLAFYYLMKTGSRGSFLACGIVALFCIVFTRYRLKVVLLGIPVILIMVSMPGDTLHRLTLILLNPTDPGALATHQDQASIESQMERQQLLKASIAYMFTHPLFGIGPGQFSDFRWAEMKLAGSHVASLGTHNSYTQIGAEAGFPALFCFAGVIILSIRSNYCVFKFCDGNPELQLAANLALSLLLACLGYGVNAFFHHSAYSPIVSTLAGTSCVLALAAKPFMSGQPQLARAQPQPRSIKRAGSFQ